MAFKGTGQVGEDAAGAAFLGPFHGRQTKGDDDHSTATAARPKTTDSSGT